MMGFGEAALLGCMVVLGGLCALWDCKKSIVPNRILLAGFLTGSVIHAVLLANGRAAWYPGWLVNMALADLIAFGMYWKQMWAAGDAKLFMLLFFLFPPRLLDEGTFSFCVMPYLFVFLPALMWIFLDSLIRWIRREKKKTQPFCIGQTLKNMGIHTVESAAFYAFVSWWFPLFAAEEELLFSVLMIAYVFLCDSLSWMKSVPAVLAHGLVLLVFGAIAPETILWPNWYAQLMVLAVIAFQRFLAMYNYQLVPTEQVKSGMIPAAETVIRFHLSRVRGLPEDASEELSAKLTEEQAQAVRRWAKSAQGQPTIWIVRKIPFAMMIVIGFVLWTVIRMGG